MSTVADNKENIQQKSNGKENVEKKISKQIATDQTVSKKEISEPTKESNDKNVSQESNGKTISKEIKDLANGKDEKGKRRSSVKNLQITEQEEKKESNEKNKIEKPETTEKKEQKETNGVHKHNGRKRTYREMAKDDIKNGTAEDTPKLKKTKMTISLSEKKLKIKQRIVEFKKNETLKYSNCHELLDSDWRRKLQDFFESKDFNNIKENLAKEEKDSHNHVIFPPAEQVYAAFNFVSFDNLKVVLIGQDPYHDNGQAEGLCFSVKTGMKLPTSLRNMYKECVNDTDLDDAFRMKSVSKNGSLESWANQGVLLLNTVLTVRAHKANSHKSFGWTKFTDFVIQYISRNHPGCVFILWGNQAQQKLKLIDTKKHEIVKSVHPSGLSANKGFFGSKPYSKTNKFLEQLDKTKINWNVRDINQ